MIFNQFEFLFLFLPLVFLAFNMPGAQNMRPHLLVFASFLFYAISGIEHALILLAGIIWVYSVTKSNAIVASRRQLTIAIIPPLLALGYYKYLGFLVGQFIDISASENPATFNLFSNIILPAGISFFTFQLVAYAIDRYRENIAAPPSLIGFALYISFFPQLVAGPILRFAQVSEAISRLTRFKIDRDTMSRALVYITVGLATKVLIADTLDSYQAGYVAAPENLSTLAATFVLLAYSFQIYFDFYGYSLMAIGLGTLFGFSFPMNFNRPYEALNPRDFWRRWHITLSYWIRDYLYFPLGGNEHYGRNILIIFAVAGLWHGAGWPFIVWGLFHAGLVILYHQFSSLWDSLPRLIQTALTFLLISAGWTLFQFDFDNLLAFWGSFFQGSDTPLSNPTAEMWFMVIFSAAICFRTYFERMAEGIFLGRSHPVALTVNCSILFVASLVFLTRSSTFIYFRF